MKITYENELRNLQSWINNANIGLISAGAVTTDMASASNICQQINVIADGIANEYPFYAVELRVISGNLFRDFTYDYRLLGKQAASMG